MKLPVRATLACCFIGLSWLVTGPRLAFANPVATDNVTAHLLAERQIVEPGDKVWMLLHLKIREGWHTYWRNPGDSGEATRIDWQLPESVTVGPIQWPYPHRLPVGPLLNFGYTDQAFHLAEIRIPADWPADKPLPVRANAQWLVCADICIPEQAHFEMEMSGEHDRPALDPPRGDLFAAARRLLPVESLWPTRFKWKDGRIALSLEAAGIDNERIKEAHFFPYDWGVIEPAAPQSLSIEPHGLTLAMKPGGAVATDRLDGILVLTSDTGDGSVTRGLIVSPIFDEPPASGPADLVSVGIVEALLLALLGGLILNLMPCVFPVLSIKAVALLEQVREKRTITRRHGFAYTAGVLLSFAMLAGLLIVLKAGGAAVGWGFQLQSPVFVGLMAYLLFFLGLSLSGFVTVGGSNIGLGSHLAQRGGYAGSFLTGILATVVATPCTAPFMGTAIGFAMTQDALVALGVFLALGFGLASPILLLTIVPTLAHALPRPGPWMAWVKQLLAFPLYASAAWLVWVISLQVGPDGVAAILAGFLLVAFAVWLLHAAATTQQRGRTLGSLGATAAVALALIPLVALRPNPAAVSDGGTQAISAEAGLPFEAYSATRLASLRAEGRAVFVNLTAAWCITCLVNEKVALSSTEIADAFERRRVAYLKGDWTHRNAAITAMLESFGRHGVPLYVFYPSDGREPEILPQLLTEALVLDALREMTAEVNSRLSHRIEWSPS